MSQLSKTLTFFTLFACLGMASPARAALVFLSPVGTVGGGVTTGSPTLSYAPGAHTLFIWVEDDVKAGQGFPLSLNATGSVAFTGAQAFNPSINFSGSPFANRWASVSNFPVGSNANATATSIVNINAATTSTSGGIRPANNGTTPPFNFLDTGYDVAAGAFLWGKVDFTVGASGTATINLVASPLKIVDDGGVDVSSQFTYGSATINVTAVPEPGTWALGAVCLAGVAGMLRSRRNS